MKQRADLVFSLVILIIVALMVWQARDWPTRSQLFPLTIGIPTLVLAAVQVVIAARRWRLARLAASPAGVTDVPSTASASTPSAETPLRSPLEAAAESDMDIDVDLDAAVDPLVARQRLIETCVWICLFAVGIVVLGFTLAAPLLVVAFLRIAARESWRISLSIALGVYVAFFFGFGRILHVPFPPGTLADTLKLDALDSYVMRPILQVFQTTHA